MFVYACMYILDHANSIYACIYLRTYVLVCHQGIHIKFASNLQVMTVHVFIKVCTPGIYAISVFWKCWNLLHAYTLCPLHAHKNNKTPNVFIFECKVQHTKRYRVDNMLKLLIGFWFKLSSTRKHIGQTTKWKLWFWTKSISAKRSIGLTTKTVRSLSYICVNLYATSTWCIRVYKNIYIEICMCLYIYTNLHCIHETKRYL